jgi:hypothetical protein
MRSGAATSAVSVCPVADRIPRRTVRRRQFLKNGSKVLHLNRLGQEVIHAGRETPLAVGLESARRECDDR